MRLREVLAVVALVMLIQVVTVLVFLSPVPGVRVESVVVAVLAVAGAAGGAAALMCIVYGCLSRGRIKKVIGLALTEDERAAVDAIRKNGGEMRQDHLVRQMAWSKQKMSAVANVLEWKGAIASRPHHKTKILALTREYGGKANAAKIRAGLPAST